MRNVADLRAFVGLDYHDSGVQVCVLDREGAVLGNGRVDNQLGAILEFVDRALDGRLLWGRTRIVLRSGEPR